mgnify:FL=1
MNIKINRRILSVFCAVFILMSFITAAFPSEAASGPSIVTTLSDNALQRGSKKTFDVWARNSSGNKIKASVKLNGQKVDPTWDDNEKTSYTLLFTVEGENIVTVSASSDGGKKKELTYHINYQKADAGEAIGTATWSVEAFTIGCGYIIYPIDMPIYEGETAAEQLIRLLHSNGFTGYYGGTVKSSFYLAYIADGTSEAQKYNSYQKSGTPSNPQSLNLNPCIPSLLVPYLKETMTFYDPDDYINNWKGYLGEFAFTNGSGWMYSINNIFPNVGFADSYLSDGDTVRVQFTLGYGADIGGFGAVGTNIPNVDNQPTSGYYYTANKDTLTKAIAKARASGLLERSNVAAAYDSALNVMSALNAAQNSADCAAYALNYAVANPSAASQSNTANSVGGNTSAQDTDKANSSAGTSGNQFIPSSSDNKNTSSDNPENNSQNAGLYSSNNSGKNISGEGNSYSAANGSVSNSVTGNTNNNNNNNNAAAPNSGDTVSSSPQSGTESSYGENAESDFSGEDSGITDTANTSSDGTTYISSDESSAESKKNKSEENTSGNNQSSEKSHIIPAVIITMVILFSVSAAVAVIYFKRRAVKIKSNLIKEEDTEESEKPE